MKNFDVTKYKSITAIILVAFLIGGVALFFICGFNSGIEFSGGTEITVNLGKDVSEEVCDKINDIITDKLSRKYVSSTVQSSISYKIAIIRTDSKPLTSAQQETLIAAIEAEFGITLAETDYTAYEVEPTINAKFWKTAILSVVIGIIIVGIYMFFRYNLSASIAFVVSVFFDIIILLTLCLASRITITSAAIVAVMTVIILTLNSNIFIFERIKNYKKQAGSNTTYKDTLIKSIRSNIAISIITFVAFFIIFAAIGILTNSNMLGISIIMIFAALTELFTTLFVTGTAALAFDSKFPDVRLFKNKKKK